MSFTGGWLRANGPFSTLDMQRVHTADPAHGHTAEPDANAPTYTAPEGLTQSGTIDTPYNEWMGGTGPILEYFPQEHDIGIGDHAHPSDPYIGGTGFGSGTLTYTQRTMPVHAQDYGNTSGYTAAPFQGYTERYGSIRSESPGPTRIDPVAIIRGPNSDPANNPPIVGQPDGFRRGEDLMVIGVDRKFFTGQRFHDRVIVTPNDAAPATRQTRGTGMSAYLSPFDSAKRAMTRAWNTPAQVDSPPDYSQDMIVDSPTAGPDDSMPDWLYT